MSGMLLYQSMIFGDKYEEDSLENRPLLATGDQDVAIVLHCFEGGICSKLILPEKDIAQGVKIKANAVKWYHLASMTMLAKLFAQLGFPLNVLSLFGDTTLRNRYKTTVDGAIVMCITSLCLFDSLVCAKKMILYVKDSIVVSLEHRIVSSVPNIAEEDQSGIWTFSKQKPEHMNTANPLRSLDGTSLPGGGTVISDTHNQDSMLDIGAAELTRSRRFSSETEQKIEAAAVLTDLMGRCSTKSFAEKVSRLFVFLFFFVFYFPDFLQSIMPDY